MAQYNSRKPQVDSTAVRGGDKTIHGHTVRRVELPRESLRNIEKNKVKRATALFETSDAGYAAQGTPTYPYRPTGDSKSHEITQSTTSKSKKSVTSGFTPAAATNTGSAENYPYKPSSKLIESVSDSKFNSNRPTTLKVADRGLGKTPQRLMMPQSTAHQSVPTYAKVMKSKPVGEKRTSALIANKAKLFESKEDSDEPAALNKPLVKLKTPAPVPEDDDVTPTNDSAFTNSQPALQFHSPTKKVLQNAAQSTVVKPEAHATGLAGIKPPKKPPRTFAHDDYMKVKLQQGRPSTIESPDQFAEKQHPFYEEVKPNGTIRRNTHKKPPALGKERSFDSVNDEFSSRTRTYESVKDKSGTYESISGYAASPDTTYDLAKAVTNTTPPKPSPPKPLPPPKPKPRHQMCKQTSHDALCLQVSADDAYHSQATVQVLKTNRDMPRKLKPMISRRGIANPSYQYSRKHECIPIQVVPAKDGSLKRFKSDECLYADPDDLNMRTSYRNPADWYPQSPRGFAHGVPLDREGYAMPYNSANRLLVSVLLNI